MHLLSLLGYPNGFEPGDLRGCAPLRAPEPLPQGLRLDALRIGRGGAVFPALLLRPAGPCDGAVLYAHAHGNRYDIGKAELLSGRPALCDPPLGLALARAGYAVLCPDMPGFGARQSEGSESALAKAALWQGRCLLGDMLADLSAALDVLTGLPDLRGRPVAAVGLSMGATLAYWLAALDQRIDGVAHLCACADMGPLIAAGGHDLHGIYMTVPGLLRPEGGGDMGDVAAMVAPRPQVIGAGLRDPLTPPAALDPVLARLRAAYADCPDRLVEVIDPAGGHAETPAMRAAVLDMLARL